MTEVNRYFPCAPGDKPVERCVSVTSTERWGDVQCSSAASHTSHIGRADHETWRCVTAEEMGWYSETMKLGQFVPIRWK